MIVQTLLVAFVVSYLGSIPPGTINISVMQLGMQRRRRAAIFLAFAASAVEFVYAGFTVQFQILLTTNTFLADYFRIVTSIALITLGLWNLFSKSDSAAVQVTSTKGRHGFVKGVTLGLLNPMTIPFWLAITTYLENDELVSIEGSSFWMYLLGLSAGTFVLLLTVIVLGEKFSKVADNKFVVYRVPGLILLGVGCYFLAKLLG